MPPQPPQKPEIVLADWVADQLERHPWRAAVVIYVGLMAGIVLLSSTGCFKFP